MNVPVVLPIRAEAEDPINDRIHPNLPKSPSLLCIYASFRSGKSVLVNNMILNPAFLRGLLDRWYVFSPTARNDSSCRFLLDERNVDIIDEYSDDILQSILDLQLETDKDDREGIGMVFDDAIQYLNKRNSVGNFLATRFRHYNIKYLIYVSQSFKALDTKIRANAKGVIIMKISNQVELEKIQAEYDGFVDGNFMRLYKYCLNDQPYSFMYLNIDASPPEVLLRFERKIYPTGEILSPKTPLDDEGLSDIKNNHYR